MVEAKKSSKQEAVKVIVRCRPLSSQEIENGHSKIVHMRTDRGQIELHNLKEQDEPSKDFTFDAIYDENSTQANLYEETFRDLVDSVLNGYNATIFAYGQTGTGKTHTMEGKSEIPDQRGVIYKCIDHIFEHISNSRNQQYLVRASYLEIYQEELRDLLNRDASKKLDIKEKPDGGVYVKDLSAVVTSSAEAIQKVMATGNSQRSVGQTNMNEHSSRSHAIFIITVECSQVGVDGENHITVGRLNLVDLAGSERQAKTGATGERFKEATKINLSLSALGNVISALVDSKSSHVPYRDSKLTRLLQDSLGGNSKTVMVACIGPASYNYEETLGTLRYANRAKNIKNQPKINEDPKDALLREFQEEIQKLRNRLEQRKAKSQGSGGHGPVSQSFYDEERARLDGDMEKIMNDDNLIRHEKEKLIKELEQKAKLLEKERMEQARVAELIASIQSRLISGEGNDHLETKTKEQQKQLEKKRKELAEQKKREREMADLLERQEEDTVDLRQTFSDLRTEVEAKTKKLKKLIFKLRQARNEIRDTSAAFSDERQDLDQSIAEINKELKLKLLIVENFIPRGVGERIKERAEWNEEDSCWNVNSFHTVSASSSSSSPLILGEGNDGMLVRSSGADSGVSVGGHSSPSTSQFLDKRLVATPGVRRPMSMCEKIHIEKAREQLSGQRRPPISGSGAYVEALIPEETIRFCGENIIVFSALERYIPEVSDGDPAFAMSTTDHRSSTENLTIDASKILAPIMNQPASLSHNCEFLFQKFKKRDSPQRLSADEWKKRECWDEMKEIELEQDFSTIYDRYKFLFDKIDNMNNNNGMNEREITAELNDSSDSSEGICADISISTELLEKKQFSPPRQSISLHSSMFTPRRLEASKIPALMTRSLSSGPPIAIPWIHGSGEDLCDSGFRSSHLEAEMLLSRSQERRKIRASSFDPRCLFALSSGSGVATSMMMTSSNSPAHSRLLPKRPQWFRHQQANHTAEDSISSILKAQIDAKKREKRRAEEEERQREKFLRTIRIFGLASPICSRYRNKNCPKNNQKKQIRTSFRSLGVSIRKNHPTSSTKQNRRKFCSCSKHRHHPCSIAPSESQTGHFDTHSLSVLFLVIAFIFRILLFISENLVFH